MKKHSAFSLIELSIVILIIGILVAGITQSSRLVKAMKLKTAQNLTKSSAVNSIKNLTIWYETTVDESFADSEEENNTDISTWNDINPQSSSKSNATQSSTKPQYIEGAMNGLPVVRFNGTDDFLNFDGTLLVNTNYTIFVVEQRRTGTGINKHFLGGSGVATNTNLHLGYRNDTTVTQDHYSNAINYTIPAYSSPIPRIHTFWFSNASGNGKKYWLNGGTTADAFDTSQTAYVASYAGSAIGRYASTSDSFNGDVAEIIIFNRALNTEERQAVESYLSQKFNVKIS